VRITVGSNKGEDGGRRTFGIRQMETAVSVRVLRRLVLTSFEAVLFVEHVLLPFMFDVEVLETSSYSSVLLNSLYKFQIIYGESNNLYIT
jgi:hypothetical protein